jgi:hypothetical protein
MNGEINVQHYMDEYYRLKEWQERQGRDAEWVALKQWWRAEARVRQAETKDAKRKAERERVKTAWLYRAELQRAWPKWARVRAVRWGME